MAKKKKAFRKPPPKPKLPPPVADEQAEGGQAMAGADAGAQQAMAAGGDASAGPAPMDDAARMRGRYGGG